MILTVDANFRLKSKDKGIKNDPALSDGWGYWVPNKDYHKYLEKYGVQAEVSLLTTPFIGFEVDV